jgi:CxxC motif-containing protein
MTTITHYLCIGCPLGCRLEVEEEAGDIVEVRGFACKRGEEYAKQEHRDPRRIVTTTVGIRNGFWARLPVKTSNAVPRAMVLAICQALQGVIVSAPVKLGQVILPNILDSGADIVATRDMPREQ